MLIFKFFKAVLLVLKMGPEKIERLEEEVKTDYLTGLLNRRGLEERLRAEKERSDRHGYSFLVVYIDVNNLKEENDNNGHEAGDKILISIASNIAKNCRIMDFSARIGGDEFVVILPETSDADGENIVSRFEKVGNVSVGYSQYSGNKSSFSDIVSLAERRMYKDKEKRKGAN